MPHSEEADEAKESTRSFLGASDVVHKTPFDRTAVPAFFFEDPCRDGNVLTQDGITQIAHHKYVPGDYTHLDILINPFWVNCTEFLPKSMAPNLVTTIGGLANLIAYLVTWYYIPKYEAPKGESVPPLLLVGNAFAVFFYYTMDCMDGKQARRTGTSSPLGQLFDHGIDCFANISAISVSQTFLLMGPTRAVLYAQMGLQLTFFCTQWEEYYTGKLSHSYGKFLGVTEVNYGLALATLFFSLLDNEALFSQTVQETLQPLLGIGPLPYSTTSPDPVSNAFNGFLALSLKEVVFRAWMIMNVSIVYGCTNRVWKHLGEVGHFTLALTKLVTPLMLFAMITVVVPEEVVQQEPRYISIAGGLCFCLITIKIIVFSMARMAYASFQPDILPVVAVIGFITWELEYAEKRRLTSLGLTFLLQLLCVWYLIRLCYWASVALDQLCERLDVNLLTIKQKKK